MEEDEKLKAKSLLLKGFKKEDVAKILKVNKEELDTVDYSEEDLVKNSIDLYSELQKELSKLLIVEMSKEKKNSDIILNSIKLQAELQEKKLALNKNIKQSKISKDYIYDRDEEIFKLSKKLTNQQIADKLKISELSVKQALDRYNLDLSEELKSLSPTIISETIGLDKNTRLRILNDAYENKYTRKDVREIVNKIKNETR